MSVRNCLRLLIAFSLFATFSANAQNTVNFGNDSSQWANDGECDDPRFEGQGMASTLLGEDLGRDATDCRALFNRGLIRLRQIPGGGPDFGNDSSEWARDGECDDPRFEGQGMASTLLDEDRGRDATDCRTLFNQGYIRLRGASGGGASRGGPDFGNDSSEWARDGECDDPRFEGQGMASTLLDEDRGRDATDCRTLFNQGYIRLRGASGGGASRGGPDFGNDSSQWARDGECDDPRFEGQGMASTLLDEDRGRDATDCRTLFNQGYIRLRGASGGRPDFGDDSSQWARDGECDDPRFEGQGMASTLLGEDLGRDATDCRALYDRGLIRLR